MPGKLKDPLTLSSATSLLDSVYSYGLVIVDEAVGAYDTIRTESPYSNTRVFLMTDTIGIFENQSLKNAKYA